MRVQPLKQPNLPWLLELTNGHLAALLPDEAAGAGCFYRRLGWDVLSREVDPRA